MHWFPLVKIDVLFALEATANSPLSDFCRCQIGVERSGVSVGISCGDCWLVSISSCREHCENPTSSVGSVPRIFSVCVYSFGSEWNCRKIAQKTPRTVSAQDKLAVVMTAD